MNHTACEWGGQASPKSQRTAERAEGRQSSGNPLEPGAVGGVESPPLVKQPTGNKGSTVECFHCGGSVVNPQNSP